MPAKKKRRYESARQLARQSNILKCAREMLSETGYAGMTMRALAQRAEVAPATLYNLYASKDLLVVAAVADLYEEMGQQISNANVPEGVDALLEWARVAAEQTRRTPTYADAMAKAVFNLEPNHPLVDGLFARLYHFAVAQLAIAAEKGQLLPHVDAENLARHLTGQGWGLMLLWRLAFLPLEDMADERVRNYLMTLISVTKGTTRRRLDQRLEDMNLLHREHSGKVAATA